MNNNDIIIDTLELTPLDEDEKLPACLEEKTPIDQKVEEDFTDVRDNLRTMIEKTSDAIDELGIVANQSQHPRAYEVLGGLIKTVIEANRELLDVHKKKKELKSTSTEGGNEPKVNNNLFVGSTSELMKMIRNNVGNN